VRSSFDLGTPSAATDDRWVSGIIAQALDAAHAGPVHINAPFREPLWDSDAPTLPRPTPVQIHRARAQPTPEMAERFAAQLTGRGIIVAGPDTAAPVHADAALALANRLGWPILADPLSALRFGHPGPVVQHHDAFLRSDALAESLKPETILHLGATPSSKPLMKLLGAAKNVLSVSEDGRWRDPWHSLDALFAVDIEAMVNAVADIFLHRAEPEWVSRWMALDETVGGLLAEACTDSWWEGAIAHQLVAQLPSHALLHVASSMPIRDLDGFGPRRSTPLRVVANRGLNGIDGLISTAAGEAHGWTDGPTVLLVGDLGFLHDVGSLSTLGTPAAPLVIVVVDNGGGGIFAHLPIGDHRTAFEPWFLTPHHSDITGLATGAGLETVAVSDLSSLSTALDSALARPGFSIIHAPVDREHSLSEHHAFWARIADQCAP
jgi:2-succinyl-5-enolpyruvyl-6-hydroxy-3-cyclohexene-1-carboxylate synthase